MSSARPSRYQLTGPGQVRLYSTAELMHLPPATWLVDGILPTKGLSVIYGAPGTGKSFLGIDLAMSLACREPWQDRILSPDDPYVVYVSAEGGIGIAQRARAWLTMHLRGDTEPRLAWLLEAIELYEGSEGIVALLDRLTMEIDRVPTFVVIDTVARCFRGDENAQVDMNAFVRGCDQIRTAWDCAVMAIHHSGLKGERERGSTALRGAADTMIRIERLTRGDANDKASAVTTRPVQCLRMICKKQKDAEEFRPLTLRLVSVPNTRSCAIAPHMRASTAAHLDPRILEAFPNTPDPVRAQAHDLLMTLHTARRLSWEDWMVASGLPAAELARYLARLESHGAIMRHGELWVPSIEADTGDSPDSHAGKPSGSTGEVN